MMRRPTRTRRLSIAAIVSCAMFVVLAIVAIRSFWTWDQWIIGKGMAIGVDTGCLFFTRDNLGGIAPVLSHQSENVGPVLIIDNVPPTWAFMGFSTMNQKLPILPKGTFEVFVFRLPLWLPLLLLLIIPLRWLIVRSVDGPAFPVVTEGKKLT